MRKCPVCNRTFDDLQSFCLEDGTSLIAETRTNSEATIVLPRKKSKLPLIFGGLLLLIGASAIAWFLLIPKEQSAQSNKQTAINVQTPAATPTPLPTETPTPPSPSPCSPRMLHRGESPLTLTLSPR